MELKEEDYFFPNNVGLHNFLPIRHAHPHAPGGETPLNMDQMKSKIARQTSGEVDSSRAKLGLVQDEEGNIVMSVTLSG